MPEPVAFVPPAAFDRTFQIFSLAGPAVFNPGIGDPQDTAPFQISHRFLGSSEMAASMKPPLGVNLKALERRL